MTAHIDLYIKFNFGDRRCNIGNACLYLYDDNSERSIESAGGEIACEKIRYRKAGDHATNMPQCVGFKGERITYSYDKLGNITEIKENGELQARYKYDTLGRLVREDNKKLNKTETYTYDGNGNILEKRVYGFTVIAELEGIEHETKTYAYDGDKLISYDGQSCEYDAIGNPTTYRGKAVTWEKDRNMTAYDGVVFAYDGRGRRMSKGNITFSYSASGKLIGQSNGVEFIYDGNGIAGIVYDDSTYFYRKDAQGNITALIDNSGNVVVRYMYDAWGNHTVRGNDGTEIAEATHIGNINPIRYRGYYYDTEIGLYYLQTRYYDPTTGRFVTIDGIAYADPESINGLNLYAYCGNNPVMNVDPTGNAWWEWLLAAIIVAACVVGAVFTGGSTLVGAAFVGAAIGGGLSLASQGINAIATGSSDFSFGQFFLDLGVGALTGAIGASGVSRIGSAFLGGVINGGSSIASDLINGKEINFLNAGISFAIGFVFGLNAGARNMKTFQKSLKLDSGWKPFGTIRLGFLFVICVFFTLGFQNIGKFDVFIFFFIDFVYINWPLFTRRNKQ